MVEIVKFSRQHLRPMLDQPSNKFLREWLINGHAEAMESHAYTILLNGEPMVCGGVQKYWDKRGHAWAIFSENAKSCFVPVFRAAKTFVRLALVEFNRIEMYVPLDQEKHHRRAELLGFKAESVARKFLATGEDVIVYSIVKG